MSVRITRSGSGLGLCMQSRIKGKVPLHSKRFRLCFVSIDLLAYCPGREEGLGPLTLCWTRKAQR